MADIRHYLTSCQLLNRLLKKHSFSCLVINTYVKLGAGRKGIGSALFAATILAAKKAELPKIDASIANDNQLGIKYYTALGFQTYRETQDMVSKVFVVNAK